MENHPTLTCKDLLDLLAWIPKGPFDWRQCYQVGDDIYWALCDPENDRERLVSDLYGILLSCCDCGIDGRPISEQAMPKAIAACLNHTGRLIRALEESVKLQSHYAELLNGYDGGERKVFVGAEEWIQRDVSLGAGHE